MSTSDSHDDPSPDSGPVFSQDAVTPRGGFMARPGLKPPPRHAVVVRVGDAPTSEAIPVARSSFPPPAPSEPPPMSASEKATLRAIPTAKVPRISTVVFDEPPSSIRSEPPSAYVALESAPPPSDSPVVQSIPPESSPRSRRRGSGLPIVVAGAAGLILGLLSVFATRGGGDAPVAAAPAAPLVEVAAPAVAAEPVVTTTIPVGSAPSPSAKPRVEPVATPKPAAAAMPKKSIF